MQSINKGSYVAVSDFHAHAWPLEFINKQFLYRYDHIYILGDVIDRGENGDGENGLSILIEVMDLVKQYPDKIHFIPGNHEHFLYTYMDTIESTKVGFLNLLRNGGEKTLNDIDTLYQNNKPLFKELKQWLENQPLQIKHIYNGKTYCMAHAFFDEKLYRLNPDVSFKDISLKTEQDYKEFRRNPIFNILWFRKGENAFSLASLPPSSETVVIGHTPQHDGLLNLNLYNDDDEEIKIVCVDGGIAKAQNEGYILKFDGDTEYPVYTAYEPFELIKRYRKARSDNSLLEIILESISINHKTLIDNLQKKYDNNEILYLDVLKGFKKLIGYLPSVNFQKEKSTKK